MSGYAGHGSKSPTVTVKAESPESAEQAALDMAKTPKSGWRLLPYQPEIYCPHIAACVQSTFPKQSPTPVEDILGTYHDSYVRYLLLHADFKEGSGTVLVQPWCTDEKLGRRLRDLARDWEQGINRCMTPVIRRGRPNKRTRTAQSR